MIILTDPTRVGPALAEVRQLQGMGRRECARQIAEITGRTETSVNSQLWTWDVGQATPDLASLGPYLAVLGMTLALDYVEDEEPG